MRALLFVITIFTSVTVYCQTRSDTLEIVRFNKPSEVYFIRTGDLIDLKCITSQKGIYRVNDYGKAIIRRITPDSLFFECRAVNEQYYDSVLHLTVESTPHFLNSEIAREVSVQTISSISVMNNKKDHSQLYAAGILMGLTGAFSYFLAPLIAKTTSSGTLNQPVYYGMAGYGALGMGIGLVSWGKLFFSAEERITYTIYQTQPIRTKKHDARIVIH